MEWLKLNWWWVGLALVALASLLNSITSHWSLAQTRAGKVLLFVAEMLSVLRSRGVDAWGKLPLEDAPPPAPKRKPLLPLLMLSMLCLAGCPQTLGQRMAVVQTGAKAASDLALVAWHSECLARAQRCADAGDKECKQLLECQGARRVFLDAMDALGSALRAANRAIYLAGMGGAK